MSLNNLDTYQKISFGIQIMGVLLSMWLCRPSGPGDDEFFFVIFVLIILPFLILGVMTWRAPEWDGSGFALFLSIVITVFLVACFADMSGSSTGGLIVIFGPIWAVIFIGVMRLGYGLVRWVRSR